MTCRSSTPRAPGLGDGTIHPLLARHTVLRRGQQLLHPVRVPPLAPRVPAELERYATLLHHARDLLLRAQLQELGGRVRTGPRGRRHALPGRPERIEPAVLKGIEAVEKVLWLVKQLDAMRRAAVRVPAVVHQGLPPTGAIPSIRLAAIRDGAGRDKESARCTIKGAGGRRQRPIKDRTGGAILSRIN